MNHFNIQKLKIIRGKIGVTETLKAGQVPGPLYEVKENLASICV